MALPRRFLPSMSLLCAFEAASRLGSFTAAAAELDLTQSAVSRQIKALETILGAELFHRERQKVKLSLAGEAYAREVGLAIARVSTATLGFRANPGGQSLNLATLPTFGARWLAPRLPRFRKAHPDIAINLQTRLVPFDFGAETVDAAIHFGPRYWRDAELAFLMGEVVVPACSPGLRAQYDFQEPSQLLKAPLLHVHSRPDAWERWFTANNVAFDQVHGMLVDQFSIATQAACAGLGVSLLPQFLIQPELERGELVCAVDRPLKSPDAYYLVWPVTRESHAPLKVFRDWILSETALERPPAKTVSPM